MRILEAATIRRGLARDARAFVEMKHRVYLYQLPREEWVVSAPGELGGQPVMRMSAAELAYMPEYLFRDDVNGTM